MGPALRRSDAPEGADARAAEYALGSWAPGSWVTVLCAIGNARRDLRIDRLLGTGGMAKVFATTDRAGRAAALKVLDREMGRDAAVRARFFREKELSDRIDHPARVPIELIGSTSDGDAVLLMELVEGDNLEVVRRRLGGKLPLVPALRIAEDTLEFLIACHAAGVLHRDVKTANILWSPGRALRIVDFGIARCDELGVLPEPLLGTPAFMAPEQAYGGGEEDPRTDLFALGAVLHTILLGRRLHRAATHDESLVLAATKAVPKIVDETLPDDVLALLDRALAFRRDDRFSSALEMRDAVRALRLREEKRTSVPPTAFDDDDGLADATPSLPGTGVLAGGGAGRAPDARGAFLDTPLPHLLVHIAARALDGTLVVTHEAGREVVEFLAGAPLRRSAAATDDPIVGSLARIARAHASGTYRFCIDERLPDAVAALSFTKVEPLDAILTSTRRLRAEPSFRTRMRATLDRLGDRPLTLHSAAAPARFGLQPLERAALDAALEFELTYAQLIDAAVAPRELVDPLLYALGITRHLRVGPPGAEGDAWPVGVPR